MWFGVWPLRTNSILSFIFVNDDLPKEIFQQLIHSAYPTIYEILLTVHFCIYHCMQEIERENQPLYFVPVPEFPNFVANWYACFDSITIHLLLSKEICSWQHNFIVVTRKKFLWQEYFSNYYCISFKIYFLLPRTIFFCDRKFFLMTRNFFL